jgi:hypothetical protein
VKCLHREESVAVGWTDPEGRRPWLGALLLAYYDPDGRLVYAGRGHRHQAGRAGAVKATLGGFGCAEIGRRLPVISRPSERALARNSGEKRVALELYRRFRRHLFDLGVVSLDRATQPLALPRLSAISAPCTSAGRVGMPEPRAMNIAVFMEEVMPINGLLMLCAVSNISASRPG